MKESKDMDNVCVNVKIGVISLLFGENYEAADDLVAGYTVANLRKHNLPCDMLEIWEKQQEQDFETVLSGNYDIIFWTIPTTSNIPEIISYSEKIKQKNPKAVTVLMGWDHHSAPIKSEQIMSTCKSIDIIIQGEGEETAVELAEKIKAQEALHTCKGIIFRDGEVVIETEPRAVLVDLDELPFPVRETQVRHNYKAARISTARGCLGNCTFCPMSVKRTTPVWRGRSPENIVLEIKDIIEKWNIRNFMFIDPTFEDPGEKGKARIRRLAELIIEEKLDITFLVNVRAENWKEKDEELLDLLFKAGLESVTVGIESGSKKNLELFNKRASLDDVSRFVTMIKKNNIYLAYGFIMFHPFSTLEDLEENNKFLHSLGLSYMMGAYFIRLKAFPGTPLYDKIVEAGYQVAQDVDKYTLYDYIFANTDVEKVSQKMQLVSKRMQEREGVNYYEIQKLTTFLSRIQRKIALYELDAAEEEYAVLENAVNNTKMKLNDLNYHWFQNCIDWVRRDGSDQEFDKMLNQQFDEIHEIIQEVKELQMLQGKKLMKVFRRNGVKF